MTRPQPLLKSTWMLRALWLVQLRKLLLLIHSFEIVDTIHLAQASLDKCIKNERILSEQMDAICENHATIVERMEKHETNQKFFELQIQMEKNPEGKSIA
eukprot:533209_1